MRIYDIIEKKRDGGELTKEEIQYFIDGTVSEELPSYQISALLMAIYFRGMNDREIFDLTMSMAHSGEMLDLSPIKGHTVDKHSTGGVGDKTTLIVAPLVASLGGVVAKMSGRGLGHTGGTVDKLESIPGFRTKMTIPEFLSSAERVGVCVVGQTGNLTPADKKLYAIRDVTATVDSIPLIVSSIMSKKLAAGSSSIVIDVKVGSGSFIKDMKRARLLAEKMISIGRSAGRDIRAVLTNMDIPLGHAVGNSLEVKEAVEVLSGKGPDDLKTVCLALAANMLSFCNESTVEEELKRCEKALEDGTALEKLCEMAENQGGDVSYIRDTSKFRKALYSEDIVSEQSGYISAMNTETIGITSVILGAGREKKEDGINPSAGILIRKKTGQSVLKGEVIATLYTDNQGCLSQAAGEYLSSVSISDKRPELQPLVYGTV